MCVHKILAVRHHQHTGLDSGQVLVQTGVELVPVRRVHGLWLTAFRNAVVVKYLSQSASQIGLPRPGLPCDDAVESRAGVASCPLAELGCLLAALREILQRLPHALLRDHPVRHANGHGTRLSGLRIRGPA